MKKLFLTLLFSLGCISNQAEPTTDVDFLWFQCEDGFIYSEEMDIPDGLAPEILDKYIEELKKIICDE